MTIRYTRFGHHSHGESHNHTSASETEQAETKSEHADDSSGEVDTGAIEARKEAGGGSDNHSAPISGHYAAQLTGIFILEFGVVLHSVFVGLTLALAGQEFKTLYAVLTFHQMFEGLSLGTRLGSIEWPASKRWTPSALAIGYAFSTPAAIGIGLGVRSSYEIGSAAMLITNGFFDSISAGKAQLIDGRASARAAVLNACPRSSANFFALRYLDIYRIGGINSA
jgi:solute carrier family 39 (zinc transporter), member 1/2/3